MKGRMVDKKLQQCFIASVAWGTECETPRTTHISKMHVQSSSIFARQAFAWCVSSSHLVGKCDRIGKSDQRCNRISRNEHMACNDQNDALWIQHSTCPIR